MPAKPHAAADIDPPARPPVRPPVRPQGRPQVRPQVRPGAVAEDGGGTGDPGRMAARLARAVDTLARLPRDGGTLPAGVRSAWLEMIRGSRFAVSETRRESRASPAPEAIDDLDVIARLLWRVAPHQRRLLWARACGVRWAELCRRSRRSRTTLTRDHRLALQALAAAETRADRPEMPGTARISGKSA